ncbi:MAG: diguanylate cyclase [Alistipes sp.]|nr:diguanylate cyclase [Alistipes sp.]
MKVPSCLTDKISKMTFCSAALSDNFLTLFGDEFLYNFVGKHVGFCFTDFIHPDFVEEFKEAVLAVEPHTSSRIVTMMADVDGLYHMIDVLITNNERSLKNEAVRDLTIFNVCSTEARHIKYTDEINKYRTYLSLYQNYLFDYDVEKDAFTVLLFMERKSTVLYRSSLKELWEFVLSHLTDNDDINKFKIFYKHLKDAIGDFSCEASLPSLGNTSKINNYRIDGKVLIKYNQKPLVQGILRPTDEKSVPFYATREGKDPATSLLNKRACYEYTADILTVQENQKHYMAVIDIDNFKNINDNYGHLFGDEVISSVASILSNTLNGRGIIGRFGGDEFYLFTNAIDTEDSLRIFLTAARQQIRYTYEKKYPDLHVTLSIGVSLYPDDGKTYDELFQKADKCLYIAKNKGKNRFIIYDEEKHGSLENGENVLRITVDPTEQAEYLARVLANLSITVLREGVSCLPSVFDTVCSNFEVDGIRIYCGDDLKPAYDNGKYKKVPDIGHILKDEKFLKFFNNNNCLLINTVANFEANNKEFCTVLEENNILGTTGFYFDREDGKRIFFFYDIFNHIIRWNESNKNYLLTLSRIIASVL